jgi:hypothetical protein
MEKLLLHFLQQTLSLIKYEHVTHVHRSLKEILWCENSVKKLDGNISPEDKIEFNELFYWKWWKFVKIGSESFPNIFNWFWS